MELREMSRWKAKEKRDKLTDAEWAQLFEELKAVCGPRPSGARMDPPVWTWSWAHNWVKAMVEHQLKKREGPATREEIRALVDEYYREKH